MVGVAGFEPAAHWSQTSCATKLRYTPIYSCLAGAVGFEPTTNGFGDRRTTAVLFPYKIVSAESLTKAIIA